MGSHKVRFCDHDGDVVLRGVVVEEVGGGYFRFASALFGVDGANFGVNGRGLPRDGFEHSVAAQRVEVGAGVCEWQALCDVAQ